MRKIIKQFRMPFKSNSPNLKKKQNAELSNNHHKTSMSTNKIQKKKNTHTKPIPKSQTETGPIIKKVKFLIYS